MKQIFGKIPKVEYFASRFMCLLAICGYNSWKKSNYTRELEKIWSVASRDARKNLFTIIKFLEYLQECIYKNDHIM